MNFALISSGLVTNVITATQEFIDANPSLYDQAVIVDDMQVSIGDAYEDGVFFVPHKSLALEKSEKLAAFQEALKAFIANLYSVEVRLNLNAVYTVAANTGLTTRAAYVYQLFTWANTVIAYASSYVVAVNALSDVDDVRNYEWNFDALLAADPRVSAMVALTILN